MSPASSQAADGDDAPALPHPLKVAALVGHREAQRTLAAAYRAGRLHHAWLIGGPQGIGKATLAWHFARFLLSGPPLDAVADATPDGILAPGDPALTDRLLAGGHGDLFVLERQWNDKTKKLFSEIRVDDVRSALGLFRQASASGGYRICIIDSAEDLNRSSANALLKIIEEPPARALFLIVAHNPGQVMPTLVSRCRRLVLSALPSEDVAAAIRGIGGELATVDPGRIREAARRARGSVGEAVRLLAGKGLDLDAAVEQLLGRLPDLDHRQVHRLADAVGFSDDTFAVVLRAVLNWLEARVHALAGHAELRTLAALAEARETIRRSAREATVLNLDKRPLLLSIFNDLARLT